MRQSYSKGRGLINAYDVYTDTILSVSSISFNDTEFLNTAVNFTIQNTDNKAVTYKISHAGGISIYTLNGSGTPVPFPFGSGIAPEVVEDTAALEFSTTSITVPPGESEVVVVSPSPPMDMIQERIPLYGGYITLNGTNGDSLSLPYMGVASALSDATILNTYLDLVYLGSTTGRIKEGHVFTLPSFGAPADLNDTSIYPKLWTGLGLREPVFSASTSNPHHLLRIMRWKLRRFSVMISSAQYTVIRSTTSRGRLMMENSGMERWTMESIFPPGIIRW